MEKLCLNKNTTWLKIITILIITSLLCQNIAWAEIDYSYLAPESFTKNPQTTEEFSTSLRIRSALDWVMGLLRIASNRVQVSLKEISREPISYQAVIATITMFIVCVVLLSSCNLQNQVTVQDQIRRSYYSQDVDALERFAMEEGRPEAILAIHALGSLVVEGGYERAYHALYELVMDYDNLDALDELYSLAEYGDENAYKTLLKLAKKVKNERVLIKKAIFNKFMKFIEGEKYSSLGDLMEMVQPIEKLHKPVCPVIFNDFIRHPPYNPYAIVVLSEVALKNDNPIIIDFLKMISIEVMIKNAYTYIITPMDIIAIEALHELGVQSNDYLTASNEDTLEGFKLENFTEESTEEGNINNLKILATFAEHGREDAIEYLKNLDDQDQEIEILTDMFYDEGRRDIFCLLIDLAKLGNPAASQILHDYEPDTDRLSAGDSKYLQLLGEQASLGFKITQEYLRDLDIDLYVKKASEGDREAVLALDTCAENGNIKAKIFLKKLKIGLYYKGVCYEGIYYEDDFDTSNFSDDYEILFTLKTLGNDDASKILFDLAKSGDVYAIKLLVANEDTNALQELLLFYVNNAFKGDRKAVKVLDIFAKNGNDLAKETLRELDIEPFREDYESQLILIESDNSSALKSVVYSSKKDVCVGIHITKLLFHLAKVGVGHEKALDVLKELAKSGDDDARQRLMDEFNITVDEEKATKPVEGGGDVSDNPDKKPSDDVEKVSPEVLETSV